MVNRLEILNRIIKNLVLISAGCVIGATVRGGQLIEDPIEAARARMHADLKIETEIEGK